jgi:hypothetical protein
MASLLQRMEPSQAAAVAEHLIMAQQPKLLAAMAYAMSPWHNKLLSL